MFRTKKWVIPQARMAVTGEVEEDKEVSQPSSLGMDSEGKFLVTIGKPNGYSSKVTLERSIHGLLKCLV